MTKLERLKEALDTADTNANTAHEVYDEVCTTAAGVRDAAIDAAYDAYFAYQNELGEPQENEDD